MASEAALTVTDLVIKYGGVEVVPKVNLSIARGEFVTLLGPSGSGKTSILRAVAGYVSPSSGDIRIRGRSVMGQSPRLRNCGMVFQNYALFPHMTVADNVGFGLKVRKLPKAELTERVLEILDVMQLRHMARRHPHELSGGQQQRVALARALVICPDLLLMDEPMAALDVRLREQLQIEIRRIQQKFQISTLYVTHDQGEAFILSDRVVVMNAGEILSDGKPRDVYLKPNCSFTARFVGSSSLLEMPVQIGRPPVVLLPGHPRPLTLSHPLSAEVARAFVVLRPEVIRCRATPAAGWSEGIVVARRFAGMSVLLSIVAEGQEVLVVDPAGEFMPQQRVWFQWDLDDAHVIQETANGRAAAGSEQRLLPAEGLAP